MSELRGRRVAFGDPGALLSHLVARSVLGAAGLGAGGFAPAEDREYEPLEVFLTEPHATP